MAMSAFRELEVIDIEPPAGVAVAALSEAARSGRIDVESRVLLNITGGGRARLAGDYPLFPLRAPGGQRGRLPERGGGRRDRATRDSRTLTLPPPDRRRRRPGRGDFAAGPAVRVRRKDGEVSR
jgi:hypothetical protein